MVTFVAALTPAVVAVNVPLVLPAAIVMLAGTVAAPVLLLVRVTTAPPAGAAAFSVTVPCDVLPPITVVGFSTTLLTATPPCVVLPPTVSPGSTDAYFLTNTLLNSATVFPSPYSATPPVARLLSTPCNFSAPSLYTSMWFPCVFTISCTRCSRSPSRPPHFLPSPLPTTRNYSPSCTHTNCSACSDRRTGSPNTGCSPYSPARPLPTPFH